MWSRSLLRPCTRLCKSSRPHVLRKISSGRPFLDQGVAVHKDETHPDHIARPSTGIDASSARVSPHQTPREQIVSVTDSNGDGIETNLRRGSQSDLEAFAPVSTSQYNNDQGLRVNDSDVDSHVDFTFSDKSQAKLDLVSAKLSLPAPGSLGKSDQRIDFLHRLDHACQESTLHGLGCLVQAIRTVGIVLPRAANRVILLSANTAIITPASTVVACIDASSKCSIELGPWTIKATDKRMRFEDLRISIRLQEHPNESNQLSVKSHTLGEDLRYLHETATMVVRRVTGALEFGSTHDMLDAVAQSLLRILQPRTSHLETSMVTVKDLKSGVCGCASWATSGQDSGPDVDRLTRRVHFAVVKNNLHNSLAERLHDDERDVGNTVPESPLSADITAKPAGGLRLTKVRRSILLKFSAENTRCRELQTRFAAELSSLDVYWPRKSRIALNDLTEAKILQELKNAVKAASTTGVLGLQQVAETLQRSLPSTPRVKLSLSGLLNLECDNSKFEDRTLKVIYESGLSTLAPAPMVHFMLPRLKMTTRRLHSTAKGELTDFRVRLIVRGSSLVAAGDGGSLSQQCSRLMRAIDSLASSVAERSDSSSLRELASECAAAILDAPTLFRDICDLRNVTVEANILEGATIRSDHQQEHLDLWRRTKAVVALGSNVGDRVENIENACKAIDADPDMAVGATSPLYETRPMYVEDQGTFVNGVCKIVTALGPTQLLDRLQSIEKKLGRVKMIDKGPRNIDLDIATMGIMVLKTERLTVPHQLMLEREFVLRPYCDVQPDGKHPVTQRPVQEHLGQLVTGEPSMWPLTPLAPGCGGLRSLDPVRRTQVMSILNVTPDSFSDGGDNRPMQKDALRETILSHITAGATIIDIGGQSSRPNAPDITAEEEIARILPAIEILKSMPEAKHVSISVDTYRAAVAEAAVKAGAHIINDISAGLLDPEMLSTVARLGCTYVMMHMRGTPATMQQPENTAYEHGLIATVAEELLVRLGAAGKAGIRRWRIILDPGVGFAKTAEQNAELLGRFGELRNHPGLRTYPWLVGSSRKGFIGKFTGAEDPKDRMEGTAATVTAAVAGGAEIVRVHDVKEMARVVKMADAMYRVRPSQPAVANPGSVEEAQDEESDFAMGTETEEQGDEDERR